MRRVAKRRLSVEALERRDLLAWKVLETGSDVLRIGAPDDGDTGVLAYDSERNRLLLDEVDTGVGLPPLGGRLEVNVDAGAATGATFVYDVTFGLAEATLQIISHNLWPDVLVTYRGGTGINGITFRGRRDLSIAPEDVGAGFVSVPGDGSIFGRWQRIHYEHVRGAIRFEDARVSVDTSAVSGHHWVDVDGDSVLVRRTFASMPPYAPSELLSFEYAGGNIDGVTTGGGDDEVTLHLSTPSDAFTGIREFGVSGGYGRDRLKIIGTDASDRAIATVAGEEPCGTAEMPVHCPSQSLVAELAPPTPPPPSPTYADYFGAGKSFWLIRSVGVAEHLIYGEGGDDTLVGTDGDDWIYGGDGGDVLFGRGGNDFILGQRGDDTIHGDDGSDAIAGDEGTDVVYGDGGGDILSGGGNFAILDCSECPAVFRFVDSGGAIVSVLGLSWGTENDRLDGGAGDDFLYGTSGNNTLTGGEGNDVLVGGDGQDELTGGIGRNMLVGGTGRDRLTSSGEDILIAGGTAHDTSDGALWKIYAEWTSDHSRSVRQANIANTSGTLPAVDALWRSYLSGGQPSTSVFPESPSLPTDPQSPRNDVYFLNGQTLRPDSDPDTIVGSNGDDWLVDKSASQASQRPRVRAGGLTETIQRRLRRTVWVR